MVVSERSKKILKRDGFFYFELLLTFLTIYSVLAMVFVNATTSSQQLVICIGAVFLGLITTASNLHDRGSFINILLSPVRLAWHLALMIMALPFVLLTSKESKLAAVKRHIGREVFSPDKIAQLEKSPQSDFAAQMIWTLSKRREERSRITILPESEEKTVAMQTLADEIEGLKTKLDLIASGHEVTSDELAQEDPTLYQVMARRDLGA